jgi:putative nucleotidyltransferase with HDIG domain
MRIFRGIPAARFDPRGFWTHSLWTACYAEALATPASQGHSVPLWLCGLLHDIGKLVLARQAATEYAEVLDRVAKGEVPQDAERTVLGFTHAELGAELLAAWRLPALLVECAARHHDWIDRVDDPRSIVALANDLANQRGGWEGLPGMTAEKIQQVKTVARERYAGYRQLFSEVLR